MHNLAAMLVVACLLVFAGCTADEIQKPGAALTTNASASASPGFKVDWDPATGRGMVAQTLPDGDRYEICLQCRYPGYTGGLWIGNLNGSGFEYIPAQPIKGFKRLNIFCAQDESILLHETGEELSNGWSENFGTGPDGQRLTYISGQILEHSAKRVVLTSINEGACLRETRFLQWRAGERHVVIAAHLKNVCDQTVAFSFWTGDDPWIGLYKSSDGDVGWTNEGFVRSESAIDGYGLRAIGMMDLGNTLLGQTATPFSGVANVLALPPAQEPPLHAYIANRFAHSDAEISTDRPLDNTSLTAFNLGWTDRRLEPGETWRIAYALGHAATSGEALPQAPAIKPSDWRFDSSYIGEDHARAQRQSFRFVGERIHLELDPPYLTVTGDYTFENRRASAIVATLHYPFPVDRTHPFPDRIDINSGEFSRVADGIRFSLSLGPHETQTIRIRYRQKSLDTFATYILTTTSAWGESLDWGHYEASWPASLAPVTVSLDGKLAQKGDRMVWQTARTHFLPETDFRLSWNQTVSAQP